MPGVDNDFHKYTMALSANNCKRGDELVEWQEINDESKNRCQR